MKKMTLFLLVMLLMSCSGCAEDMIVFEPLDMRVYLSQTEFTGPQEVEVSIIVYNHSDEDRPGPLALYWPNGEMIEEVDTPTLKAGERLEWTGNWFVTQEQINWGRVPFGIRYIGFDEKGDTCMKGGTVAANIISLMAKEAPLSPVLVLESNRTTGYDWSWVIDNEAVVAVSATYVSDMYFDVPDMVPPVGGGGRTRFQLTGLTPGETTITFAYKRFWREDTPIREVICRVSVDEDLNVTILSSKDDEYPDSMFRTEQ